MSASFEARSAPRSHPTITGSAPDCRTRRALLHPSHSCASPCLPAALVTHGTQRRAGRGRTDFRCGGLSSVWRRPVCRIRNQYLSADRSECERSPVRVQAGRTEPPRRERSMRHPPWRRKRSTTRIRCILRRTGWAMMPCVGSNRRPHRGAVGKSIRQCKLMTTGSQAGQVRKGSTSKSGGVRRAGSCYSFLVSGWRSSH